MTTAERKAIIGICLVVANSCALVFLFYQFDLNSSSVQGLACVVGLAAECIGLGLFFDRMIDDKDSMF